MEYLLLLLGIISISIGVSFVFMAVEGTINMLYRVVMVLLAMLFTCIAVNLFNNGIYSIIIGLS